MIQKKANLRVAEMVLQSVNHNLAHRMSDDEKTFSQMFEKASVWVECFSNGREQGYVIICWVKGNPLHLAFSENRNSDEIVVYKYYNSTVDNKPQNEEDWNDRKYFGYGKYDEASEYIIEEIKKELNKVE